jgi:subtilisin family serine protease
MSRWYHWAWLLATAPVAAAGAMATAQTQLQASSDALPSREILVMLKIAPQHLHAGSAYRSDGSVGRYGDPASVAARRRTAESIARKNGFTVVEGWPMPLLGVDCYVMRLASGSSIDAAIVQVSRDPRVAWSEPVQLYQAQGAPDRPSTDPLLPVEPASASWHLADLHKYASGRGINVAIIDSKVDVKHPDLAGHFIADENFLASGASAPEQHGTAVAGIIGAAAGNGVGIAGMAPGARMMALRACWQVRDARPSPPTLCESLGIARALQYAIDHNAQVINLSLSGPPGTLLSNLISIALKRNASVVAAFDPAQPKGGFPASQAGVIAVADEALHNLPGNVYAAPGRDIPTTQPGGRWYLVNGTSYSAAHVSGLIALVRERRSSATLVRTASGHIDACASLLGVPRRCDCPCGPSEGTRLVKR